MSDFRALVRGVHPRAYLGTHQGKCAVYRDVEVREPPLGLGVTPEDAWWRVWVDVLRQGEVGEVDTQEPPPRATSIVQAALSALEQRAALRDQPTGERSAGRAAAILSAWTGRGWDEQDVWRCLIAVKLAREVQGRFHLDDYVDIAGYAGLLGESLAREVGP